MVQTSKAQDFLALTQAFEILETKQQFFDEELFSNLKSALHQAAAGLVNSPKPQPSLPDHW
ncbi:hypothetical protein AHMF7605_22490 [Adhaeribacter arboris]|uniref:Uncharacterized protein n=1 Tax=Adhaeribacter arboris TaxID=2072846 RepID=A0A2T2YKP1_9BACT|nr:hypothetical protein [Adhaeribacter arboris]PSR56070.1 hypothetical protein AHMF7605_22490 [Adhaeribacter arboris]